MTIWTPEVPAKNRDEPLYRALATEIGRAVSSGDLLPGDRLPTQRALARRLGVALTTVTRAYAEAEQRGLVRGEVGRGTFVRGSRSLDLGTDRADLRTNSLMPHGMLDVLADRIGGTARRAEPLELFGYAPHGGRWRHRVAGAAWLERAGLETDPANVVVTAGVQHGMAVVLATLLEPGDTLLVERYSYAGIKALANLLHVRLVPLPMDDQGLLPDALDRACGDGASALYCMSTIQNPLTTVMRAGRREEVAGVLNRHGLPVVEDDTYAFVEPDVEPLTARCEHAYYLNGVSKSVLPALRIGYARAPAGEAGRLEAAISSTVFLASPLTGEIATEWIEDGTADRVVAWKREEMAARTRIVRDALDGFDYVSPDTSPHGWLRLPEPWTARDFVAQAAQQGVDLTPADEFAVGRGAEHAVRICVGPPPDRSQLEIAVATLRDVLDEPPEPIKTIV